MRNTSLVLGSNWDIGEWPEYISVIHEASVSNGFFSKKSKYVPERTCKPETIVLDSIDIGIGYLDRLVDICSECGERLTLDYSSNAPQRGKLPNYCPQCGARVVK